MKMKDINRLFGVAPSTLSDWSKEENKKRNLAQLLKNIDEEEVRAILAKKPDSKKKPLMLLSTVNCSIGNKEKHYTLTKLKQLFYKKDELDKYDKYALKTIKKEALPEEIEDFINYYKISPARVSSLMASL